MKPTTPEAYAAAVVDVLANEFTDLAADPAVARVARDTIARHAASNGDRFEWIVDWPSVENWRLKSDRNQAGRIRLACYKATPTDADLALEATVNAHLAAL
ncbi:hypothetical protein ACFY4C_39500 [Actinomadura viridis]|uniref:hypothetical protein n=1 Tax=Actinomadura viridis TaxID=58110 RepID=UPI0036C26095